MSSRPSLIRGHADRRRRRLSSESAATPVASRAKVEGSGTVELPVTTVEVVYVSLTEVRMRLPADVYADRGQ